MAVFMSNPSFPMKAVILKANIEKRTIREMGGERSGEIMLTDRQQDKKKSSWSFVYCNCQNLQRVTITHDAIFYSLPFLHAEVVHLPENSTRFDMMLR